MTATYPQLFRTLRAADLLLRRELGAAHRNWVLPKEAEAEEDQEERDPDLPYTRTGLYLQK